MESFSADIAPGMRIARPGPGKGCRPTRLEGMFNSLPSIRTSSQQHDNYVVRRNADFI